MGGRVKVKVMNGTNLVVRDFRSSDPYVILKLGPNRASTKVVKKNLNPVWNEEFIFPITDANCLLKLEVWDKDWVRDDKMGKAEVDLKGLMGMGKEIKSKRVVSPCKGNCLYKDSFIMEHEDGKRVQEACLQLQLRNVNSGLLTLQFEWPV